MQTDIHSALPEQKKNFNELSALPVVLAAVDAKSGLVFIEVEIEDHNKQENLALFDTGAGISIISSEVAANIHNARRFQHENVIRNASGDVMKTAGKIELELNIAGKCYKHAFIISTEKQLPAKIILGYDFMKKYRIELKTHPLSISMEGQEVTAVELNMEHALNILNKSHIEEEVTENELVPCIVDEAKLIKQQNAGFVMMETKFVNSDVALFEPVPGNVGAHTLCPGLVRLESDRDKKKSRFIIKYINVESQDICLEPGRVLGYIQPCAKENLKGQSSEINASNEINALTATKGEERQKGLKQTVDKMFPPDSKENRVIKGLINKYPSVFANDDDPPNITPYYYHTIRIKSEPIPKRPYQIPNCLHEKVQQAVEMMEQQGIIRPSK